MVKFSVIIPAYNVRKYIKKCLDSVCNQVFTDYEVIVVNDGCTDNTMDVVIDYDVRVINQENLGLSEARNVGIKAAKGEFLVFVDADDYVEKDLLLKINEQISSDIDVLRFQVREIKEDGKNIDYHETGFGPMKGADAFSLISKYHFIENAWCYVYRREYFVGSGFSFRKGTYHEDFGLIPLVIMKANSVKSIDYIGYNYVERLGSIMHCFDYIKIRKKVDDFYLHYKYLLSEIDRTNYDSRIFKSYASNSMILKMCELYGKEYKEYKKFMKKEGVYKNILTNTLPRKVKKVLLNISPKLYFILKGY